MWIKLISPRMSRRRVDTALKTQMAPSLALLTLGALTPGGHRVTMEDENVERLNLDDRPDLVGITVKIDTALRSWAIADGYRRRGVPVVLGGIHPTSCPGENLAHADAIVVGEAEEIWGEIVRDAAAGRLRKIYRQSGPTDLSRAPVPRWELIRGKDYLFPNTLVAGRGCPWSCDFCYSSAENVARGHRMKPVANVVAEIASLGLRHVFFIDDNFIGSPARARELMQAIKPLGLTWHTAVSADVGRYEDILDLMAETGCQSLFIGFESVNELSLADCRKRQNRVDEYAATMRKIHDRGMMVNASLVFGFDGDGPRVFKHTLHWLVANKVETMTAHILTPYPGTRFYARLLKEGRITDFNLDHYNTSQVVFRPRGMTARELQDGYYWIYRELYSIKRIWRRLPESRSQWAAFLMFNLLYRKFGPAVSLLGRWGLMGPMARLARALAYPARERRAMASDLECGGTTPLSLASGQ